MRVGGNASNRMGWDLWVSLPTIMAKVKIQENSQIKLFCKIRPIRLITQTDKTNNAGLDKRLQISVCPLGKQVWYFACPKTLLTCTCLSLWSYKRIVFLDPCTFGKWAWKVGYLPSKKINSNLSSGYVAFLEPCNMKDRFHLYVHTIEFCADFKTESIRKLSSFNFQWTKPCTRK